MLSEGNRITTWERFWVWDSSPCRLPISKEKLWRNIYTHLSDEQRNNRGVCSTQEVFIYTATHSAVVGHRIIRGSIIQSTRFLRIYRHTYTSSAFLNYGKVLGRYFFICFFLPRQCGFQICLQQIPCHFKKVLNWQCSINRDLKENFKGLLVKENSL